MTTTHPAPPDDRDRALHRGARVRPRPPRAGCCARARRSRTSPICSPSARWCSSTAATRPAAIAALLHDVVEDGGGVRALAEIDERFGTDVAAIVEGCSDTTAKHKEDWTLRKTRYLAAPRDRCARRAARLRGGQAAQRPLDPRGPARARRRALGALQQQPAPAAVVLRRAARHVPAPPAGPARGRARPHRARDRTPLRRGGPRRLARPALRVLVDRARRVRRVHRLARLPARRREHRSSARRSARTSAAAAGSTRTATSRPRSTSTSTGCASSTPSRTSGRG